MQDDNLWLLVFILVLFALMGAAIWITRSVNPGGNTDTQTVRINGYTFHTDKQFVNGDCFTVYTGAQHAFVLPCERGEK